MKAHLAAANVYANLSYCTRLKVGCVIVKGDAIISYGYNGTPAGEDNVCEGIDGLTLSNVIHAEHNAFIKLSETGRTADCVGATVFVTASPCVHCAAKIIEHGVTKVVYQTIRNNTEGIDVLTANGVTVEQMSPAQQPQ